MKGTVKYTEKLLSSISFFREFSQVSNEERLTIQGKQALNIIIAFFLAKVAEQYGTEIDYSVFIPLAYTRAMYKTVSGDIRGDVNQKLCQILNCNKEELRSKFLDFAVKDDETAKSILDDCKKRMQGRENEKLLWSTARTLANYIISKALIKDQKIANEIMEKMQELYNEVPYLKDLIECQPMMNFFEEIANLSNKKRWNGRTDNVFYSDLGHNFDVAMIGVIIVMQSSSFDFAEKVDLATKVFFVGIFHDVTEGRTGDFPSPVKDWVHFDTINGEISLRKATEELERQAIEEMTKNMPEYLKKAFINNSLEFLDDNDDAAKIIRQADKLSVIFETHRGIITGSRDPEYKKCLLRYKNRELKFLPKPMKHEVKSMINWCLRRYWIV